MPVPLAIAALVAVGAALVVVAVVGDAERDDFRRTMSAGFPYSFEVVGEPGEEVRQHLQRLRFAPAEIDCIVASLRDHGVFAAAGVSGRVTIPSEAIDRAAAGCDVDMSAITYYTD